MALHSLIELKCY